jgi:hypothetical protein
MNDEGKTIRQLDFEKTNGLENPPQPLHSIDPLGVLPIQGTDGITRQISLRTILDASNNSALVPWVPQFDGITIGNAAITSHAVQTVLGGGEVRVDLHAQLTIGTTTVFTGPLGIRNIPVTPRGLTTGIVTAYDSSSGGGYIGYTFFTPGSNVSSGIVAGVPVGQSWNNTAPFLWALGDHIIFQATIIGVTPIILDPNPTP